jgi:predicted nucleic acid-binding protein
VTILGRRKGFGYEKASKVGAIILSSPRVFVIYMDELFLKESLQLYPSFKGKLGMTDTSSLVVMKRYAVKEIFSHDTDFDSISWVNRREN